MTKFKTKPTDPMAEIAGKCNAKLRNQNRRCRQPAGYKTPHMGQGRCWLHGGATPIRHGRYSKIQHTRLRSIMDALQEQDTNPLDLEPEARLMRALVIDYANRYEEFITQLDKWYTAMNEQRAAEKLPPVPRRYPDLMDLQSVVESTSRIVERIHKIQREGSITLDTMRAVMQQMGLTVSKHVDDVDTLKRIEKEWSEIVVDPKSFVREDPDEEESDGPNTP